MSLGGKALGVALGVDIALTAVAIAGWTRDAPPPQRPFPAAAPMVRCLLDVTGFDPYQTSVEDMEGAMHICLQYTTRDLKKESS